jgi:hypothetical protein
VIRRPRLALAGLAVAALAGGGCGNGNESAAGDLRWVEDPRLLTPPGAPRERVLSGTVRNDSLEPLEITAAEVEIVDRDGDALEGNATFIAGYAHGLYPPIREPATLPDSELTRLGRLAQLDPGEESPLTAAWRLRQGAGPPVRIDYGTGSLPIP